MHAETSQIKAINPSENSILFFICKLFVEFVSQLQSQVIDMHTYSKITKIQCKGLHPLCLQ